MRLKTKGLRGLFVLSFLFLIAGIIGGIRNIAYGSLSPLAPSVEVSPSHTYLGGEMTLVVKVLVDEKSNVSVSNPTVMGVGDANLTSTKLAFVVANASEVATLKWTYCATQVGTIYFSVRVSVKNLVDNNVTLSEELNSREIGISTSPRTSLLGFAIISLYILLSSYFSEFKPQISFTKLIGGRSGISMIILCLFLGLLVGHFVTSLVQTEIWQMVYLGFFGSILSGFGLFSCWKYSEDIKRAGTQTKNTQESDESEKQSNARTEEDSKKIPIGIKMKKLFTGIRITELGAVAIAVSGLSGYFLTSKTYLGLVLVIVVGIIAIGKECMERKGET